VTEEDLDFSGFQRRVDVPPPPKRSTTPSPKKGRKKKNADASQKLQKAPVAEPVERRRSPPVPRRAPSPRPGRKKRVNVSLPVDLSRRFTGKASEEDRYLTDMVLDAYRNHYADMREGYIAEKGDTDLPFRPRRRKTPTGRVTHMLYLASPEVAVIDGSATEIGLSRSELVSRLLERELG
jgi:hypothetical protein